MRPSRRLLTTLAVALSALTTACGGGSDTSSTKTRAGTPAASSTAGAPTGAPTALPTPVPTPAMAAPVIIQIENSPLARPQTGISGADIVYEYETEGGITRFSTFWFSGPAGSLGPVRSARIATVQLLQIYGGTLLYSGAGNFVEALLGPLRHFSEGSGALFRVGFRAAPHNLYTDGAHVAGLRAKAAAPAVNYQLWARTPVNALPAGGSPAPAFTVPISSFEQPRFTYDPASGGYRRSEPTGLMTDAGTGKPWILPTVVVLQVPVSVAPQVHDVNGALGLNHSVQGTGQGQVITGGFWFPVTFNQGPSGPPVLTLPSGAPAPIAPGQVMVILVRQGTTIR